MSERPNIRCVNLDWFEVHCWEPSGQPHDATFFRSRGLVVEERTYGTRVYREMFTIFVDGHPWLEVRRNPFSQGIQGIHAAEECHLRLVNAACYYDDAVSRLSKFLNIYDYQLNRVVRADICMDFELFDHGDRPADFVRRYFKHRYAKINQGNITSHGSDTWSGQNWNSLSWGSYTSDIGTKLYNKTLELYDAKTKTYAKPHIRYAWFLSALIDDFHNVTKTKADGTVYTPEIWRVEFSIRSSVRKWFKIELNGKTKNYQSIRNTLDMYDSRDKLLTLFAALSKHYFHFKKYEEGVRKDRCEDKVLFDFHDQQYTYKVGRDNAQKIIGDSRKQVRPLDSLLIKLREYAATHTVGDVQHACQVLINSIESETLRTDLRNPWSNAELLALRLAVNSKAAGNRQDVAVILRELKRLLSLNDNTVIF